MDFKDLFDLDKVLDEFEASEAQLVENGHANGQKENFIGDFKLETDPIETNFEPVRIITVPKNKNFQIPDRKIHSDILPDKAQVETDIVLKTIPTVSSLGLESNVNLLDVNSINDHCEINEVDKNEEIQILNEISADAITKFIEVAESERSTEPENQKNCTEICENLQKNCSKSFETDVKEICTENDEKPQEKCSESNESDENLIADVLPTASFVGFSNVDEDFHEEEFDENEFEKYLSGAKLTNDIKHLEHEHPMDLVPEHPIDLVPEHPIVLIPEHPANMEPDHPSNLEPEHPTEIEPEHPIAADVTPKFSVQKNLTLSEELAECQFEFESNFIRRLDAETVVHEGLDLNEKMATNGPCGDDLQETTLTDVQVNAEHDVDSQEAEIISEIAQNAENLDENGLDSDVESLDAVSTSPTVRSPEHHESIVPVRSLFTVSMADEVGTIYKPTESELQLGKNAPVWIPDNDTMVCMLCESRFNVIKRRHHCRACGRVLCGDCCRLKAKLPYVENKEVRICSSCSDRLKKIDTYEKNLQLNQTSICPSAPVPPDPSSTPPIVVPSTHGASADVGDVAQSPGPPDPVSGPSTTRVSQMVPVGVLKRGSIKKEPKQVIFSDGIKPGGDLSEPPPTSVTTPSQPPESSLVSYKHPVTTTSTMSPRQRELQCFLPIDGTLYPPVVADGEIKTVDVETLRKSFSDAEGQTVIFAIKKNLTARVSFLDLDCCVRSKVWCFASDGLRNVAQDELLIVVVADGACESMPPVDVLRYYNAIYEDILKGKPMSDMSYGVASQLGIQNSSPGFMGSKDNAGFLHTRPTYQCLKTLSLPEDPFLIGVLIQKVEVPWAKVLPLRLALRLGAESKYYPWSLISDPFRKPVVSEIGHTIMSVLNDFRNFTYNIAHLPGSWITLEEEKTVVNVPAEQYNQVLKILSSSNEHVLSWATSFCYKADSHLVCVQQTDTGTYLSQTINKEDRIRKVTGGCFVIFNASLKAGGPMVRSSIVEDGVMIQVRPETMESIRDKLHRQQNFKIQNEPSASPSNSQPCSVEIRWGPMVQTKLKITSPIDGRSLSDAPRYRLYGKVVEASNGQGLIRLVALFILPNDNGSIPSEPDDLHSIVKKVSLAVGSALLPHFSQMLDANLKTVGVRFTVGADMVDYAVGSNCRPLPDNLVPLMDDCLIPVLHARVGDNRNSLKVELTLRLLTL